MELTFHDGTVRDVVFMQDASNRSSLLISGGAGDCKIYVTDCETGTPIRIMTGHSVTLNHIAFTSGTSEYDDRIGYYFLANSFDCH